MCFGLRNAGQTFQRHIDNILRGLPVFPFVDDILIASVSEDDHKKDLEEVLKRLDSNGLLINVAKCVFGQRKLDFLGYTISERGITPTGEKVQALKSYPLPTTIQDLRRFMGMMNFYRESIPHAAHHQRELNLYLHNAKKNDRTVIQWTEAAKRSFEKCKKDIENAVCLSYPSSDTSFALMTDASDTCAGAVLQQKVYGRWSPLGFFSKKLNEAQQKYSTYDRELLSIYLAVRHFRRMFEGRNLVIYTDHKPLTHSIVSNSKTETPRRTRYLEYIGQFTSDIRHISGKDNQVADTLSRIETISCLTPIDYESLAKQQAQDEDLIELRRSGKHDFRKTIILLTNTKVTCEFSSGTV